MRRDLGRFGGSLMDTRAVLLASLAVLALGGGAGCAPKKIPGTDINDSDDTRAILDVIERFRRAYETKDAQSIAALLDENVREDGGRSNPDDDFIYTNAGSKLEGLFSQTADMRLDVSVRKIEFDDKMVKARAVYTWNSTFKLPSLTPRPQSESEIK